MPDSAPLKGRCALVTGGGRGIGRAVTVALARAGARVAVHFGTGRELCLRKCFSPGRRAIRRTNDHKGVLQHQIEWASQGEIHFRRHNSGRAAAEATRGELPGTGHAVLGADLADPDAAAMLAGRAAVELGGLDIVVNNAGVFEPHDIAGADDRAWRGIWDRTLAVNLTGPALVIRGAVPHLTAAGGGHVVNVSSRGAYRGEPEAPAYGAAKAGLNSLTQSLAAALASRGIHVVGVAPGWVATDMTRPYLDGPQGRSIREQSPHGRTATPEEVAEVVLLAVSGRADALAGAVIDVNLASHFR